MTHFKRYVSVLFAFIFFILLWGQEARADTISWQSPVSNDWSVVANWSGDVVSSGSDNGKGETR